MGNLSEKLEQMSEKLATKLPEDFLTTTRREVQKLIESDSIHGLSIGEDAPRFTLPDATGKTVSLADALEKGPVVLSFYRGSW